MRYLHTMVRVKSLDQALDFYVNKLGLEEVRRSEHAQGRFTLVFLRAPGDERECVELTWNWDPEDYTGGRNFGHIAFGVKNIYQLCQHMMDQGVTIYRLFRDGYMAFVRSPEDIFIELF